MLRRGKSIVFTAGQKKKILKKLWYQRRGCIGDFGWVAAITKIIVPMRVYSRTARSNSSCGSMRCGHREDATPIARVTQNVPSNVLDSAGSRTGHGDREAASSFRAKFQDLGWQLGSTCAHDHCMAFLSLDNDTESSERGGRFRDMDSLVPRICQPHQMFPPSSELFPSQSQSLLI
jgi:hypothetical protein